MASVVFEPDMVGDDRVSTGEWNVVDYRVLLKKLMREVFEREGCTYTRSLHVNEGERSALIALDEEVARESEAEDEALRVSFESRKMSETTF